MKCIDRSIVYGLVCLGLCCLGQAAGAIESDWRLVTPWSRTNRVDGLDWDGSSFVAVGSAGSLLTSTDGLQWALQRSGTDSDLHALTHDAAGRHVAVGQTGAIVTEADSGLWAPARAQTSEDLLGVASDGQQFVAVGSRGTVLTSPDGLTWTLQTLPTGVADVSLRSVAWHGGQWLAGGNGGTILSSLDGRQWSTLTTASNEDIDALRWWEQGKLWLAATSAGNVLVSPDAKAWQPYSTGLSQALLAIGIEAGTIVVAGDQGGLSRSLDGQNWSPISPLSTDTLRAMADNGSRLVAMGDDAVELHSDDGGQSWTLTRPNRHGLRDVTWNGSWFIAVGEAGTILRSSDGLDWQAVAPIVTTSDLHGVAWDAGSTRFRAVGECGVLLEGSANGDSWTGLNLPGNCHDPFKADAPGAPQVRSSGLVSGKDLNDIVVAGTRIVAVGDWGTIIDSQDGGLSWSNQAIEQVAAGQFLPGVRPQRLNAIGWNGFMFVAIGRQGTIVTSPDGRTWTARDSQVDAPLEAISWDAGTNHWFVAGEGVLLSSVDGQSWTIERSLSTAAGASGNGVARILDLVRVSATDFVAAGWFGVILESSNGLDWTTIETGLGDVRLHGVGAGPRTVVAVGDDGVIMSRADTADLVLASPSVSTQPRQGSPLTLRVDLDNTGVLTATSVKLVFDLPADLDPSGGITPGQGSCSIGASQHVVCALGDLSPGASTQIDLRLVPSQAGTREIVIRASTTATETRLDDNTLALRPTVAAALPGRVAAGPRLGGAGCAAFVSLLALLIFAGRRMGRAMEPFHACLR